MKITIAILMLFCGTVHAADILDNSHGQVLGEQPFFNPAFIKSAKIKKIKGFYSTKASMDIIRSSNQFYTYEFDKEGRLIREYLTKNQDTIVKLYTYDSNSRISYYSESNYYGFKSQHFVYDSLNRIVLIETRRETNLNKSKIDFNRGESYEISNEKFEYVDLENGNYKKLYYNSSQNVFKEEIVYHDKNHSVNKQETRMMMGSARKEVAHIYDTDNRYTEFNSESWIMGHKSVKYVFEYDEKGRVLAKHYFKNNEYITEYQIIHNEKNNFLTTILSRDVKTDFITILEFDEYAFYP